MVYITITCRWVHWSNFLRYSRFYFMFAFDFRNACFLSVHLRNMYYWYCVSLLSWPYLFYTAANGLKFTIMETLILFTNKNSKNGLGLKFPYFIILDMTTEKS